MKISALLYHVLLYGSLGVAGIALFWRRFVPAPAKARLPNATLLGSPARRLLGRIAKLGHWGVFFIAGALALFLWETAVSVVVVTDGGGSRMVHLGGSVDYPLAPGEKPWSDDMFEPTWVVNESSHDVKIVHVEYGNSLGGFGQDPTLLPPGTATAVLHVDDLGPENPPPQTVMDDTGLKMDFRDWVTW